MDIQLAAKKRKRRKTIHRLRRLHGLGERGRDRGQMSDVGGRMSEDRGQRTEDRRQRSEVRGQKAEGRSCERMLNMTAGVFNNYCRMDD